MAHPILALLGIPTSYVAVVPSDTTPLPERMAYLYVGAAGDLTLRGADGNVVTHTNVPAGTLWPCNAQRVMAASTASGLVAWVV